MDTSWMLDSRAAIYHVFIFKCSSVPYDTDVHVNKFQVFLELFPPLYHEIFCSFLFCEHS